MPNEPLINEQIDRFIERRGIRVSEHSRKFIQDLFDAVVLDPHPRWRNRNLRPNDVFNIYVNQIPDLLNSIAVDEKVEDIITTWDIMHWVGPRINFLWRKGDETPQMPVPKQPTSPFTSPTLGIQGTNQEDQDNSLFGLANEE